MVLRAAESSARLHRRWVFSTQARLEGYGLAERRKKKEEKHFYQHTLGASAKATAGEKAIPPRAAAASGAKRYSRGKKKQVN